MSNRVVELAIEIASRASTAGMDATVTAAKTMRREVTDAADTASGRLDKLSGAADNLDDKAGRATGALGALSSGFALVGAEKYAGAIEAAAMATDFASGIGQAFTLVTELESLSRARAAVAAGAHAAATTAAATAAKVAAGAQAALNVVLAANPIALVVIAVVALVAAFVLAYKRSETFRNIVQSAMAVARNAVNTVVDKVSDLVGWVVDRAIPIWSVLRDAVATSLASAREKFGPILDTARNVFGNIRDAVVEAIDLAKTKVEWFREKAVDAFNLIMTPINAIKDAITWIIDKLATIKLPKLPDLNPLNGRTGAQPSMFPGTPAPPVTITLNVALDPLTDPNVAAGAIVAALSTHLVSIGRQVVIV